MCGGCVKTEYPPRGNTCLENGSYLMNYVGCAECKTRDFVMIVNKATEDEDGEEIITYDHVCKNCHHVIARHEYTFGVVDDYQFFAGEQLEFTMFFHKMNPRIISQKQIVWTGIHHAVHALRQGGRFYQCLAR